MPTYEQTVRFERRFTITAPHAGVANERLDALIRETEWNGEVNNDGFYEFEDDPITCPECSGNGIIYKGEEDLDGETCPLCEGEGSVPFTTAR